VALGPNEPAQVSLVIADDATVRDLNSQFRGLDEVTDVLFPSLPTIPAIGRGNRSCRRTVMFSQETRQPLPSRLLTEARRPWVR